MLSQSNNYFKNYDKILNEKIDYFNMGCAINIFVQIARNFECIKDTNKKHE